MANLIPVSSFDDVVALAKGDPIIGARLGMSNKQAQQLLNRFTYLLNAREDDIDALKDTLDDGFDYLSGRNENLSDIVEMLDNKSDVTDVVGTYSDLQNYDTTGLGDKDIIKVLSDSTQNGRCSYYRWSTVTDTFSFIGVEKSSVPILVTDDMSDSPITNVTYVVSSGCTLTITAGNDTYVGVCIKVIAKGNCTLSINSNNISIAQEAIVKYRYDGSVWFIDKPNMLESIYPVGHLYISFNEVSPATFIGGTWSRFATGYALITAGSNYVKGNTYGANSKTLTPSGTVGYTALSVSQIPSHVHNIDSFLSGYVSADHVHGAGDQPVGNGIVPNNNSYDDNRRTGARSSVSWPGSTWADSHYHGIILYFDAAGSSNGHNHPFTGTASTVSVVQPSVFAAVWIRTA